MGGMRWDSQRLDLEDPSMLPGMPSIRGLLRSVQVPEFPRELSILHQGSLLSRVQVEPVFSFHTRVGLVKTVPAGTGISYGRTHIVPRETRIAVLTGGYGDGIPRACSNRAQVLIRGRRCPVLGRVTMDQTIVDVTATPGVEVGDQATLVGTQQDASIGITEFSRWGDTIPWETLTSVTKRVPRVYRTGLGL